MKHPKTMPTNQSPPKETDANNLTSRGCRLATCCASSFGDRLRKTMEAHNMTQTEFAEKSGCQLAEINHWVSGRRQPHVSNLARLIRVLPHARLDWLIAGGNNLTPLPPGTPDAGNDATKDDGLEYSGRLMTSEGSIPSAAPILHNVKRVHPCQRGRKLLRV